MLRRMQSFPFVSYIGTMRMCRAFRQKSAAVALRKSSTDVLDSETSEYLHVIKMPIIEKLETLHVVSTRFIASEQEQGIEGYFSQTFANF